MLDKMGSRRSSDTTSLGSRGSISLEYDDFPLDLVSPIAPGDCADLDLLHSGISLSNWKPSPAHRPKKVCRQDRFSTENEVNTDLGRRSYCDYDTEYKAPNGDVFITHRALASMEQECHSEVLDEGGHLMKTSRSRVMDADEAHYQKPLCCGACSSLCDRLCKPCLRAYHPLPDRASRGARCRHAMMLPPQGRVAHTLTLIINTLLIWGALWGMTGRQALPGGNLFSVMVLVVAGYLAGAILQLIKLPPVLGKSEIVLSYN